MKNAVAVVVSLLPIFAFSDLDTFVSPGSSLANADIRFIGETTTNYAGYNVASAGDVDADGFDDVLVSAHSASYGALKQCGKVYLFLGSTLKSTGGDIDLSAADYQFYGSKNSEYAGVDV